MVDLKERFHALDQVPAPDLSRVIELRARHLASVPGALGPDPAAVGHRRPPVLSRQLLAAAAIVILGLGVGVIIHQARSTAPAKHVQTPNPTIGGPGTSGGGIYPTMRMTSLTVGWASIPGPPGQILSTADGGTHWTDVTPKEALAGKLVQPVFVDESSAWLLARPMPIITPRGSVGPTPTSDSSDQADIWRTQDAGKTWQRVASLTLAPWFSGPKTAQELRFVDRQHGWLSVWPSSGPGGMILYRTMDGGVHWTEISVASGYPGHSTADAIPADCLGGISFTNERDGWVGAGCSRTDRFFATHDGGVTWKELPVPPPMMATFNGSEWHFEGLISQARGSSLLFTVIGPANGVGVDHELYSSTDGGVTWIETPLPQGRYAPGAMGLVSLPPSFMGSQGWIVIDGGMYVTHDAGTTWQQLGPRISGWDNPAGLQFVDASTGWVMAGVAGGKTALLRSSDGGRTWTQWWTSK